MKLLWLGQSGLLFDFNGLKIMVDPYLTDSLAKQNYEFARRTKINKKLFKSRPDIIVLTNCHLDHADNASLERLLKHMGRKKRATILSCESVFDDITTEVSLESANHIMLDTYSEWTVGDINIQAVPAKTDDKTAIGIIITDFSDGKKYYVAGDTLYNKRVIENLPNDIYAAFLPINGEFGSMNVTDAKRFAERLNAHYYVPVHFGMFDKVDPKQFNLPNAIIPKAYKVIDFSEYEAKELEFKKKEEALMIEADDKEDLSESTEDDENVSVIPVKTESNNEIIPENEDDLVIEDNVGAKIDNDDEIVVADNEVKEADDIIDEIENDTEIYEDEAENEIAIETTQEDENTDNDDVAIEDTAIEDTATKDDVADIVEEEIVDNIIEKEVIIDTVDDVIEEEAFEDEIENENAYKEASNHSEMDDSDKIDAYIREIEKFERGETTDFSVIDGE